MAASFTYPPNVEDTVSTFANPRYSNASNTYPIILDCIVNGVNSLWYATPLDPMDYGLDIYNRVVALEWGPIANYVAPIPPTLTQAELLTYANDVNNSHRRSSHSYILNGVAVNSDVNDGTLAEVNGLAIWGNNNSTSTTQWVDNYGTVTQLTGAQCVKLQSLLIPYNSSIYYVLAQASSGISSGAITTTAEIDALAWPT